MIYSVTETFSTLQGEGAFAGRPSVFVRFSGCNLWSGKDDTRERDAERHRAACPRWCDTDFASGERKTEAEIVRAIADAAQMGALPYVPHIVFTGGEPFLQLRRSLLREVRVAYPKATIAVETNGSRVPDPDVHELVDWVTVSPKQPADMVRLRRGNELKVVWPGGAQDPESYAQAFGDGAFVHYYVSPLADTQSVGRSLLSRDAMREAASYVLAHPRWRLTLQMHKVIGLP